MPQFNQSPIGFSPAVANLPHRTDHAPLSRLMWWSLGLEVAVNLRRGATRSPLRPVKMRVEGGDRT